MTGLVFQALGAVVVIATAVLVAALLLDGDDPWE